jgi:tRNA pseudouridine38-40 synthase
MDNTRNIKLLIAYDGTDFCGWQKQDHVRKENTAASSPAPRPMRTVQGVIEQALGEIHGQPVGLTGSGRTDAGVHAVGQAANFYTDMAGIPAERFAPALNSLLPPDVRVLASGAVSSGFHARFDASMRTYRYHFIPHRPMLPHESRYNVWLRRYPNLETLNGYCRLIHGEQDCTIFAAAGDTSKSFSRYISSAVFFYDGGRLIFEISANAFLRKMVRSVAGTFLHYEETDMPPGQLREIIAQKDRALAGPTLPPQGLFLWKIEFERNCRSKP